MRMRHTRSTRGSEWDRGEKCDHHRCFTAAMPANFHGQCSRAQEPGTSIHMHDDAAKYNTKQTTKATKADKMHDAARHSTNQRFPIGPPVERDYTLLLYRRCGGVLMPCMTEVVVCGRGGRNQRIFLKTRVGQQAKQRNALSLEVLLVEVVDEGRVSSP